MKNKDIVLKALQERRDQRRKALWQSPSFSEWCHTQRFDWKDTDEDKMDKYLATMQGEVEMVRALNDEIEALEAPETT